MRITAKMVAELRDKTSATMDVCKLALMRTNGNMEEAEEAIRVNSRLFSHNSVVESLTRENAQLKALIAEQKDSLEYWIANSATLSQERLAQDIVIAEQKEMIESCRELSDERLDRNAELRKQVDEQRAAIERHVANGIRFEEVAMQCMEQSALIEKLGEALTIDGDRFGIDQIIDEALAELAAWRKK